MSVKKCGLTVFILVVGLFTSKSHATEELDLKLRLSPGQKYGMSVVKENRISQMMMQQQHEFKHIKTIEMAFFCQ